MIFAEQVANNINWTLICAILVAIASLGMWIDSRKQRSMTIAPQPLIVAMQKEFASKHEFDQHVAHNDGVHRDIFSKIGGVERGAATSLERQLEVVRKDVVLVSNQVSGLKSAGDLQNQQLARMDSKLDRLAEK